MRLIGLMALYLKSQLSTPGPDHKVYPYLLKGLKVSRSDQARCVDITYIRIAQGFVYLVAILDCHIRYVFSWILSTMLDKRVCLDALQRAPQTSQPEIFSGER